MHGRANNRRVRIEFGDCDPAKIAYYPNFVVWVDESTHHLFESVGFIVHDLQENRGLQIPVVDLNMKFFYPAGWGDEIHIESKIDRWGTKSFNVKHRITNARSGELVAEARETRVCVKIDPDHPKELQGLPVPSDIRAAFGGMEG